MKQPNIPAARPTPLRNRLQSILIHVPRYQGRCTSLLAADAGVAKSAVSRLLRGIGQPDYVLLYKVAEAIGREIGRPIDLRELAVPLGCEFPTRNPCAIFGCRCLPPWAYRRDGSLKPRFEGVPPGEWTDETLADRKK